LRNTAIVHKEFESLLDGIKPVSSIGSKVNLTSYEPNHLTYKTELSAESFVVFSEIWYTTGWKAYIDGTEQPLIRANYALRALRVPAGTSQIELKFEPKVWAIGQKVSLVSSVLLLLLIAAWAFSELKGRRKPEQQ